MSSGAGIIGRWPLGTNVEAVDPTEKLGARVSDLETMEQPEPPVAGAKVVYLGPVAPHWEVHREYGEQAIIDAFAVRTGHRLLLLPAHDPQFRRNRERVARDAERENIELIWDLGLPEE